MIYSLCFSETETDFVDLYMNAFLCARVGNVGM